MKDLDKKQLILNELKWTTIYFVAASVIIIFLPFPADLVLALMAFWSGWFRRYLLSRKLGMKNPGSRITGFEFKKIRELFKSNISVSNDDSQIKVSTIA